MKLDRAKRYSRINSVLMENGVKILRFHQEFPVDIEEFNENNFAYHDNYIKNFPHKIEFYVDFGSQSSQSVEVEMVDIKSGAKSTWDITNIKSSQEKIFETEADLIPKPSSRKDQVRCYLNDGLTSPKEIATLLGTNPSYVQRLIKEIQNGK